MNRKWPQASAAAESLHPARLRLFAMQSTADLGADIARALGEPVAAHEVIRRMIDKWLKAGVPEDGLLRHATVTIHCGSRGLGHQIGTEFLKEMAVAAGAAGIVLPDRELACAPIRSEIVQRYLGAMRAAIDCALANREILGHLARRVVNHSFTTATIDLLFDVSHDTCKVEPHLVDGKKRNLFVHRKGATRAFGPGHPSLPPVLREVGQPVLIGGSMGTGSYILVGTAESETKAFSSACHGAGRALSRHAALRQWSGRKVVDDLAAHKDV
jgi:tRNA-splicing ligase RtcB (3'-phosphate/5'-hydroxy nucleic acid ligase)